MKYFNAIIITVSLIISTNISAALIDNGITTTDTNTGLVWLDLSETYTISYIDTYNETLPGGIYEGYRVATRAELGSLFNDYIPSHNFYDNVLWDLWGRTSNGQITGVFYDDPIFNELNDGVVNHGATLPFNPSVILAGQRSIYESGQLISTALVQTVPLPASLYLLITGLVSLFGFSKYYKSK